MQVIDQSTSRSGGTLGAPTMISLTDIRIPGALDDKPVTLELPAALSWLARAAQPQHDDVAPLLDAAAVCIARWGVAKTTAGDVAEEAGCSRATLYRRFPGGRDQWLRAVVEREAGDVVAEVLGEVARTDDLVRAVALGVSGAIQAMWRRPVLSRLLEHERELLLPEVLMDRASHVYVRLGEVAAPALSHLCDPDRARTIGEWGARLVVARALQPELPGGLAVEDPNIVAHLASRYLLPGLFPERPSEFGRARHLEHHSSEQMTSTNQANHQLEAQ